MVERGMVERGMVERGDGRLMVQSGEREERAKVMEGSGKSRREGNRLRE